MLPRTASESVRSLFLKRATPQALVRLIESHSFKPPEELHPPPSANKASSGMSPARGASLGRFVLLGAHRKWQGVRVCIGLFLFSWGVLCREGRSFCRARTLTLVTDIKPQHTPLEKLNFENFLKIFRGTHRRFLDIGRKTQIIEAV